MAIITFKDLGQQGRLGNQLFQIATTLSCAIRRGDFLAFPEWEYSKFLNVKLPVLSPNDETTHIYHEPTFEYYPILLDNAVQIKEPATSNQKVINLSGYFQSEKYFKEYTQVVRDVFTPRFDILEYLKNNYEYLFLKYNTCAVHVRRGDYVNNPFYYQLDINYYKGAMDIFYGENKSTVFLIFSDDIEWCKSNFKYLPYSLYFVEGESDFYDLTLMSICDNHIIANSSFSWWGAWLGTSPNKRTVFPSQWFGPSCNHNSKDLYF